MLFTDAGWLLSFLEEEGLTVSVITQALTAALPEDTDNPENAVAPDPR